MKTFNEWFDIYSKNYLKDQWSLRDAWVAALEAMRKEVVEEKSHWSWFNDGAVACQDILEAIDRGIAKAENERNNSN
jgi:hypothetical protein